MAEMMVRTPPEMETNGNKCQQMSKNVNMIQNNILVKKLRHNLRVPRQIFSIVIRTVLTKK